ncbi:MAG: hypothetical protein ACYTEL_25880 [Planctomycetota bacterium]|jgi:hypothetical protein
MLPGGRALEALGCLNKAGESGQAWTSLALYETELKGLLGRIVELPKDYGRVSEIVREGMRLADGCGRRGYDFKELYDQLAAKAESLR